tara:strand:+ start:847 stop:1323 length:477 start_codon:yes stop_codon:yes gene_type:complete
MNITNITKNTNITNTTTDKSTMADQTMDFVSNINTRDISRNKNYSKSIDVSIDNMKSASVCDNETNSTLSFDHIESLREFEYLSDRTDERSFTRERTNSQEQFVKSLQEITKDFATHKFSPISTAKPTRLSDIKQHNFSPISTSKPTKLPDIFSPIAK